MEFTDCFIGIYARVLEKIEKKKIYSMACKHDHMVEHTKLN